MAGSKSKVQRGVKKLWRVLHSNPRSQSTSSSPADLPPAQAEPERASTASQILLVESVDIETLPPELNLAILSWLPDLRSLNTLVRASPSSYRAYQTSKHKILASLLRRELAPSILFEARSASRAKYIPRDENWLPIVTNFMDEYKASIAEINVGEPNLDLELGDEDVEEMAKRHLLIQTLTGYICTDTLLHAPVTEAPGINESRNLDFEISETERHRIYRSLYRYQLFVTLFGDKSFQPSYRPKYFWEQEMATLVLSAFAQTPWEAEELACVRDWVHRVYGQMLQETKQMVWERDMEAERDELGCFVEEGKELEERAKRQVMERHEFSNFEQCETLLHLGFPYLLKVLHAPSPEEKYQLLKPHLIPSYGCAPYFLTRALEVDVYLVQGDGHRRRRVAFEGNNETGPNAAWVWSKHGRDREDQETWYEEEAEEFREWGYVMWDAGRLRGWGFVEQSNWRG